MAKPIKRSTVDVTPDWIRSIEYVLPKLKYSTYISHIKEWFENFDKEDQRYAYDFLFYLEYISFNELQYRLSELIKKRIVDTNPGKNFLFIPFAKYGKSCDLMIYLISHTLMFKELEGKKRARCERSSKGQPLIVKKDEIVIFVDDFIGTGKSFLRDWQKEGLHEFMVVNDLYEKGMYYVAAIAMQSAKEYLKYKLPEVTVIGDTRSRIFCPKHSPFILGEGSLKMKEIAIKYGLGIRVYSQKPMFQPLGFSNSEALIAFDHSTPNNTLPIIWGDKNWYPIYPRLDLSRMDQAKALKREAAFYIGIMNRLKLDLYKIDILKPEKKRELKYNNKSDHSIITLLILKDRGFNDLLICQILGITFFELDLIYIKSFDLKFTDGKKELTSTGVEFIRELFKATKSKRIRTKEREAFERKNYIYVPKKFEGIA